MISSISMLSEEELKASKIHRTKRLEWEIIAKSRNYFMEKIKEASPEVIYDRGFCGAPPLGETLEHETTTIGIVGLDYCGSTLMNNILSTP